MPPQHSEYEKAIAEQFETLPHVVQEAILSADVETRLRELWQKHQLHVDQWASLQDEVMLTLLGLRPVEKLQENIRARAGVPDAIAASLAEEISHSVFEPIRQELERELEHPEAKEEKLSDVEAARASVLQGAESKDAATKTLTTALPPTPAPSPVQPATPPPPPPVEKVVRGPVSGAYAAGSPSTMRKDVHDDPYREPPK